MPLTLTHIPGFADVSDDVFLAEALAVGLHVGKVSENAAFGMGRFEMFQGVYQDGETVPLPTSRLDGYQFSRNELYYSWTQRNTGAPDSDWYSALDTLWYLNESVNQDTGLVTSAEWYRRSGKNYTPTKTKDGNLLVTTYAQRGRDTLLLSAIPTFQDDQSTLIGVDKPWKTGLATSLNIGAKFAVVNCEAIYMGEFVSGQTVPRPTSPADSYQYAYAEVIFIPSWRYCAGTTKLTTPEVALGQLQRMQMSISNVGLVTLRVDFQAGDAVGDATQTTQGKISVIALCSRTGVGDTPLTVADVNVPAKTGPWDWAPGGLNTLYQFGQSPSDFTTPVVVPGSVTAGQTIKAQFYSGSVSRGHTASQAPGTHVPYEYASAVDPNPPVTWYSSLWGRIPTYVMAFCDGAGAMIECYNGYMGAGGISKVVPVGATQVQLGINDVAYSDNTGAWVIRVTNLG